MFDVQVRLHGRLLLLWTNNIFVLSQENDCRYPDQVRFMIRPGGLTCEVNRRSSRSSKVSFSLGMLALVFMVVLVDKIGNYF